MFGCQTKQWCRWEKEICYGCCWLISLPLYQIASPCLWFRKLLSANLKFKWWMIHDHQNVWPRFSMRTRTLSSIISIVSVRTAPGTGSMFTTHAGTIDAIFWFWFPFLLLKLLLVKLLLLLTIEWHWNGRCWFCFELPINACSITWLKVFWLLSCNFLGRY